MTGNPLWRGTQLQLLTSLVDAAPVGAAVLDLQLRYLWVNQTLCEMNGHSQSEHVGHTPREILGSLGNTLEELLTQVMQEDSSVINYRFRGARPGLSGYWMGSYFPLRDERGALTAVGAIVTDITDHERGSERERQFLTGLVRVAQAAATNPDTNEVLSVVARESAAVLELDGAVVACFRPGGVSLEGRWGNVVAISEPGEVLPAATTPLTELVRSTGQPQRQLSEEPDALGFRSRVAAPITVDGELWGAIKAGTPSLRNLPGDAEQRLARFAELVGVSVANATTQSRLIAEASHDPLTGLCNRRAFQQRMQSETQRALRHESAFSLVLLDIDHFKEVNDSFGHQVGDEVLVETARRLSNAVRAEDLLARIGGEEFALILPGIGGVDALMAAERARHVITIARFEDVGRITLSAGVASFDEAGSADSLFRQADRALYEAKRRGRDRSIRHAEIHAARLAGSDSDARRAREAERAHALPALRALARAIDAKDPATFQHSERVAHLAQELARLLGWSRTRALELRDAALLHDVGKIGVPEELLFKPGRLTQEEFEQVKAHARLSWQISHEVVSGEQAEWILHHHERWDGDGYPGRLCADSIPDGAQLLAVADAWDAMTVARPYAQPLSHAEALEELLAGSGRQFAPLVVNALVALEPDEPAPVGWSDRT